MARSRPRDPQISGLPTPQGAVASGSRHGLRRPLKTKPRPSSTFPGHVSAYGGQTTHTTTQNAIGRHHLINNSPRQAFTEEARPSHVTSVLPYWCVNMFCNRHHDRHVYTTCEGWKRHMKEHETIWPCMPYGPLEATRVGLICALCGSPNPSESHMAGHSIGGCGDTSTKLSGVSRRVNLERHLQRSHAVSDASTRGLANKWKTTRRKIQFACGFCVCVFSTIHEQLNHIDMDHFKKGQQIAEWSATKVIQGLLLSPKIASFFQYLLLSNPNAVDRDLHWDWQVIEDLQRRLETAEDAAETLALEAYRMLTFNLSQQRSDGQPPPMCLSGPQFVGHSEMATGAFTVSAERLEGNNERQIEEVAQGSEHPWLSDEHYVATPRTSCSNPDYWLPMNQSNASEAPTSMEHQRVGTTSPRDFPIVSTSSARRPQPPHFPTQTTSSASSITELSSTSTYDSSGTSTHWQAPSSPMPSTLQSTGAAGILGEYPKICQGHTHDEEAAGTLTSDLDGHAQSSSLERDAFRLDTCDPRDLIKRSR